MVMCPADLLTPRAAVAECTVCSGFSWLRLHRCRYDHQQPGGYQQGFDNGAGTYPVKDFAHEGGQEFQHDPAAVGSRWVCTMDTYCRHVASGWLIVYCATGLYAGCIAGMSQSVLQHRCCTVLARKQM